MHLSEDTLIGYYCGNVLDQWHFEGLIVMSRTFELNADREDELATILAELEITDDQMCKLTPEQHCPAQAGMSIFDQ